MRWQKLSAFVGILIAATVAVWGDKVSGDAYMNGIVLALGVFCGGNAAEHFAKRKGGAE